MRTYYFVYFVGGPGPPAGRRAGRSGRRRVGRVARRPPGAHSQRASPGLPAALPRVAG